MRKPAREEEETTDRQKTEVEGQKKEMHPVPTKKGNLKTTRPTKKDTTEGQMMQIDPASIQAKGEDIGKMKAEIGRRSADTGGTRRRTPRRGKPGCPRAQAAKVRSENRERNRTIHSQGQRNPELTPRPNP